MGKLTRDEISVARWCVREKISAEEESLKAFDDSRPAQAKAKSGIKRMIERLQGIAEKLDALLIEQRVGTNLDQSDYERLEHSATWLDDTEAKALINKEYGFEYSQITILREAEVWELDKTESRWTRKAGYNREPLYDASDWNYIRFNVKGDQYEFINGQLYFYED